jgi:SAM-dependent methyltransferase
MYFNDDISDRLSFSSVSREYDLGRPGYPKAFYDHIRSKCGGSKIHSILEIGAGSGQATADLVTMCNIMECVEPGVNFYDLLQDKFKVGSVKIHNMLFEDYHSNEKFDLVVSASALHWIPKEVFYGNIHGLLNDGGVFAGMWYQPKFTQTVYNIIENIIKKVSPDFRIPSLSYDDLALFDIGFEEFSFKRGFTQCEKVIWSSHRNVTPTLLFNLIWSYLDSGIINLKNINELKMEFHSNLQKIEPKELILTDNYLLSTGVSAYT